MAQVDTSIYSNFQPNVRLQTPFEIEAGMQQLRQGRDQNRLAQRQSQEADRVDAERNALSGLATQYGNTPEYGNKLMEGGFAAQAQAHGKYQREAEVAGVELKNKRLTGQKLQSELSESERIQAAQRIGALRGHPYEAVVQDMTNGLMDAVTAGKITQEEAEHKYAMMLQKIPRDQAGLDAFIDSTMLSVMTPQQQAEGRTKERDFRQKAAQDAFNADRSPNIPVQQYELSSRRAGATKVTARGGTIINEAAREKMGGKMGADIGEQVAAIEGKWSALDSVREAKQIMSEGIYSGAWGPLGMSVAKRTAGAFGDREKAANTEAYVSFIGNTVIPRLKEFGGNDSNEEMKYLQGVMGGRIEMEPEALNQILNSVEIKIQRGIERLQRQQSTIEAGGVPDLGGGQSRDTKPQNGQSGTSKSGKPMVYRNGQWEYK